jgi:hypothetical protein
MKRQGRFPKGWDEARVRRVLRHYESQTDEEAVAEDEAAFDATTHTAMKVPVALVPEVRRLLAMYLVPRPARRASTARRMRGRARG